MAELVDRHTRFYFAANVKKGTPMLAAIKIPRPRPDRADDEGSKGGLPPAIRALAGMSRVRYAPGPKALPAPNPN